MALDWIFRTDAKYEAHVMGKMKGFAAYNTARRPYEHDQEGQRAERDHRETVAAELPPGILPERARRARERGDQDAALGQLRGRRRHYAYLIRGSRTA